jgi:hypothetical protein
MIAQESGNQMTVITKVEWRLQDVNTGQIMPGVYDSEKKALWHDKKSNQSRTDSGKAQWTKVVKVKSTYEIKSVVERTPKKIRILKT